ncbi:MAG: uncharacterized protein JWO86_6744 [Myxococcaceae bacterium]|nr:uncharacterized protein [Myxococcaceae bacterium]
MPPVVATSSSATVVVIAAVVAVVTAGCHRRDAAESAPPAVTGSATAAPPLPPPPPAPRPVGVETVPVDDDLPAFVVRASAGATASMLFIPGMCVHPGGYIQAFQYAAAARGDLVTVQGDVACGGDGSARRWSGDLDAMNERIERAYRAAGLGEPRDVVVVGYSQGAERAERLVARWPARYTRAVLIASPIVPSPLELRNAGAVVLMAGTFDAQTNMRGAVGPLRHAGIAATFLELPGARHGQMGTGPEETMAEALDFALERRKMNTAGAAPSHGGPAAR